MLWQPRTTRIFTQECSHTASSIEFAGTSNYLGDFYTYYVVPLDSDFGVAWTTAVFNTETFGFACIG